MNDVKLRDQRKPGHCWQDNELYDAFGPVIGPNAVTVYTHMTRQCYGTEIRSSSRDLAEASGLSKNTVWRAMRVMERIGMLRAVASGPGKVAEYHLVDLKELAASYGGVHDWKRQSYVFSALQTAALKTLAAGGSSDIATVPVGDSHPSATVPVGDSSPVLTVPGGDSAGTQLSQKGGATVPPEGRPYTRQQDLQDNPPTPQRGANDLDRDVKIATLRLQRQAATTGSPEWWQASRELQQAMQEAEPPAPPQVQTGPDPPGRRRRQWTPAMVGARM